MNDNFQIRAVRSSQEIPYHLLVLADPSSVHVEKYLKSGNCYIGILANEIIGVLVTLEINERTIEVKNIAIKDTWQGKGYGKMLLEYAEKGAISGGLEY